MNIQKELINLYGSDSLFRSAIGVWLKFTYEFLVVTLPLGGVILMLGHVHPSVMLTTEFSSNSAFMIWGSISLTVTGIVWCFSLTTIHIEEGDEDEEITYEEEETPAPVPNEEINQGNDADEDLTSIEDTR